MDDEKNKRETEQKKAFIARVIQRHGTPNATFPADTDLPYGVLKERFPGAGLLTLIKNMKKEKRVDYSASGMLKDEDIVTLVADYNAPAQLDILTPEQIRALEGGTAHERTIF